MLGLGIEVEPLRRLPGTEWRCRRGLAYPRERERGYARPRQPTLGENVVHFLGYIIHSRF